MSFNIGEPLYFNREYFLNGTIDLELESLDHQLERLYPNFNNLDRITKQFNPSPEEFRNDYLNKNLRDSNGNTLLHKLVLNDCHLKYFKAALRDLTLDINAQNNEGDTPYHLAARLNSDKYLRLLKEQGAKTDICNNKRITVYQMRRL